MKLLKLGSIGPSVQLLQLALGRAGQGGLRTDGIFGTATQYALRQFQSRHGLTPDGVAGALTHRALLPYYTGYVIHNVSRGDTLSAIAAMHGSTVSAIELANPGICARNLPVGAALV
ncbi:MAG: peptidoglycan-binding protein, partial [Oscillospiraceae bacterium]|nr:peptidoglycan-binding protein [Oscillospiraceae bacterium]